MVEPEIFQEMLLDLLVHPKGPQVRDRISHGEVKLRKEINCVNDYSSIFTYNTG